MPRLGELDRLPVSKIPVESLKDADSPRSCGESSEHAHLLAESGCPLPPIIVCRPTMRVIDGMHRLHAARLRGDKLINVRFFDGDQESSFVLAVQANIKHGLPLSLTDRKAAAARITNSYPEWSDRMIASVAGLAASTVAAIRKRTGGGERRTDIRVGRDGRARPVNIAERRTIARNLVADKPDASLREIAREAGISAETVRDIRTRLQDEGDRGFLEQNGARKTGRKARNKRHPEARVTNAPRPDSHDIRTLQSLMADPALRYTESGRSLLRLLQSYQILEESGRKLIEAAPEHCMDRIAYTASACARMWHEFADEIEQQRRSAAKQCP